MSDNCTNCSASAYRTFTNNNSCPCIVGYADIGITSCIPCSYYIPGCDICLNSQVCSNCSTGFSLDLLGYCQCNTGYLVTGICTTITGCISATSLQNQVYCLACNTTLNFIRTANFTCVCSSGFILTIFQVCQSICGDSQIVGTEGCDDGNLVNGDGCSSTCQIETSYYCDNSSPPSICYVIGNVTATVYYVKRDVSANRAIFGLNL